MARRVERQSYLQEDDWRLLLVYRSEHCKETLLDLKYKFSLEDFVLLEEHVNILNAFEEEANKKMENKQR